MPKISALTAGTAPTGAEVAPFVQAGATVKLTVDQLAARAVAYDAELAAIAGLTSAADRGIYFTGSGTASLYTFTAAGRAILDDADATAQRATLGLVIGTDVQAYNARLADIAGIAYAQGDILYHNGANLVKLAAGTSGHFLKTNGAGANPEWAAAAGTMGGTTGGTDNAILRADGTGGATVQSSALTIDDTGIIGFPDDVRQTFNPGANAAGLNVGSIAGDPGTPSNGDLWYDSTANELTARINGANVALGAGGGGSSSITVNAQTGTTYTVVSGDQGKLITFSNASSIAVTLPQATGSFGSGFFFYAASVGAGQTTITPTTSTIAGVASYVLKKGGSVFIVSDGTNYQVIPSWGFYGGTGGGISVQMPDSGTGGGNVRGSGAVDLQVGDRTAATQVASGQATFAAGRRNIVSGAFSAAVGDTQNVTGTNSFASGGANTVSGSVATSFGSDSTVSADYAFNIGRNATASGTHAFCHGRWGVANGVYSVVWGYGGTANSNVGVYVYSAGSAIPNDSVGSAQEMHQAMHNRTTGSSAVRLTANGSAAGSTNVLALPNNSSVVFTVEIVIRDCSTGNTNTYSLATSLITRGASAATTAMSAGNPAVAAGPTTGTALTLAAAPTVTADTTNGGFNISYTPPAGNTNAIHAVATIRATQTVN